MSKRSDSFDVPNGTPLDEQLGYIALSVVVDNFTSSWCYVPAAQRYVPPGGGGGFSLEGTQNAKLVWNAPPGKVQVPPIPTEVATVTYSESEIPGTGVSSAVAVSSAPASNITQIGGGAITLGQKTSPASIPVVLPSDQADSLPAELAVTATAAAGVGVTATLPAPPAGSSHYVALIQVVRYATAALAGGGVPLLVTTTNLPGNPVLDFSSQAAAEGDEVQVLSPAKPLKSAAAATQTTVVCPATANVIWRVNVWYHQGP